MREVDPDSYRRALEVFCKRSLARVIRLVLWEPVESLKSFIEVLSPCIVEKLQEELPDALRKNRVDDLEKRALRWLERSFWDDICHHPDDPLDKRTLRLKKLFDATPTIPPRRGDSEHFPISVFIEYELLKKRLEPVFKRRPPTIKHLPKAGTEAKKFAKTREGGHFPATQINRRTALEARQEQLFERWKKKRLQLARRVIPIEFWPVGEERWFTEEAITDPNMTARTAALMILGAKIKLRGDAVLKLLKKGKQMLPQKILKKLERKYDAIGTNEAWQFLNRIDRLV